MNPNTENKAHSDLASLANGVKNIVWDLGGVLYATDLSKTLEAFKQLIPGSKENSLPPSHSLLDHPAFTQTDTDELSPEGLRIFIRNNFGVAGSDAEIDAAWNSLLIGVMPGRIELLQQLKPHFRLFLLSNTNRIHQDYLKAECKSLFSNFEGIHFSFDLKLRKPNTEIYNEVCRIEGLNPAECLFIDDNEANVEGARKAGWKAYHFESEENISGLIKTLLPSDGLSISNNPSH